MGQADQWPAIKKAYAEANDDKRTLAAQVERAYRESGAKLPSYLTNQSISIRTKTNSIPFSFHKTLRVNLEARDLELLHADLASF